MVCCLGSLWEGALFRLRLQGRIINVNVFLFYHLCKTQTSRFITGSDNGRICNGSIFPGKISFLFFFILVPLSFLFQSFFFLFPLYHALPEKETHSGKWGYGQRGKNLCKMYHLGNSKLSKLSKVIAIKDKEESLISSQVLSVYVKALFTFIMLKKCLLREILSSGTVTQTFR